jgi:hypothetical protein
VEDQAEIGVLDEREEPIRAVSCPFDEHRVMAAAHLGLDVGGALADDSHVEPLSAQEPFVRLPARAERLVGVVERIDVPGHPRGVQQRVERGAPGDVALAGRDALVG